MSADGVTDKSLGELVASLTEDARTLARGEVELAKAELSETAKRSGTGVGLLGGAGLLGLLALVLLSIAAAYGLVAAGLHPAWAFLIVAVVYLLIAAVLVLVGQRLLKKASKGPERTIEAAREAQRALRGST